MVVIYDAVERRRKEAQARLIWRMVGSVLVMGALALAFQLGLNAGRVKEAAWKAERDRFAQQNAQLQSQLTDLKAQALAANNNLQTLQAQYNQDIGDTTIRQLVPLLRDRLQRGISAERLAQVLATANTNQQCSTPEVKRLIVKTPASRGPASKVALADGLFNISAEGISAHNKNKGVETWFDPAEAIKVTVAIKDLQPVIWEDKLPLHNSISLGKTEYRFTITKSAQSYIEIVLDQCARS